MWRGAFIVLHRSALRVAARWSSRPQPAAMGILSTLINVVIASGFIASLGWVLFAASVPPQEGDSRPGGDLVKSQSSFGRPRRTPAPVVKPSNRACPLSRARPRS